MTLPRQSAGILIMLTVTLVGMAVPGVGGFVGTAQPQSSTGTGPVDVNASDLSGDGSESNPYDISSVSELQAMEDELYLDDSSVSNTDTDTDTSNSPPTVTATIDESGELGATARVNYTLKNIGNQSSVELNITDSQLTVNESASEFDGGETEADGQRIRYSQPSQVVTPTIGYDIPRNPGPVPFVIGFELTLPVTVELLTENSTMANTVTVAITPGVEINRTVSAEEVPPSEQVTVTTEIRDVDGSVLVNSTYNPALTSATIQSVMLNGDPAIVVPPGETTDSLSPQFISKQPAAAGSNLTGAGLRSNATVVVTEQLTVANKTGVTHNRTSSVRTVPSNSNTSIKVDPVSVRVTESTSVIDEYDTDDDGTISIIELGQAGQAFASGELSITELGQVGAAFAS